MLNAQTTPRSSALPRLPLRSFVSVQPSLLLNVAGPIGVYQATTSRGASEQQAVLLAAAFPLLGIAVGVARHRRIDLVGAISLSIIVLGAVLSVLLHDPRILLVKESIITGLVGLAFLSSILAPRPLGFLVARRVAGDGTAVRVDFERQWQTPRFRTLMRQLTAGWGVALVVDAAARVGLSFVLQPAALMAVSPLLLLVTLGPVAVLTLLRFRVRPQQLRADQTI